MAVIPCDMERVVAGLLDTVHPEARFEHREQLFRRLGRFLSRLRSVRARARRAGAPVTQVFEGVRAVVPVLPVDINAARFGYRDVFRVGCWCGHSWIQDW